MQRTCAVAFSPKAWTYATAPRKLMFPRGFPCGITSPGAAFLHNAVSRLADFSIGAKFQDKLEEIAFRTGWNTILVSTESVINSSRTVEPSDGQNPESRCPEAFTSAVGWVAEDRRFPRSTNLATNPNEQLSAVTWTPPCATRGPARDEPTASPRKTVRRTGPRADDRSPLPEVTLCWAGTRCNWTPALINTAVRHRSGKEKARPERMRAGTNINAHHPHQACAPPGFSQQGLSARSHEKVHELGSIFI